MSEPLDLEKIELFARRHYFDSAAVASQDVLTLLAEVRALRAEIARLKEISEKVWCDNCDSYSAKVIKVDEFGDEIIQCPVCKITWAHP